MKNWFLYNKKADSEKIAQSFGISPVLAKLVGNRNMTTYEQIDEYLYGDRTYLHNPFFLNDMQTACSLIEDAVKTNVKIRVVGDYDVDGVCASYILKKGISSFGGVVDAVIPHRMDEGYGINTAMVDQAFADGIGLLITCDNGIKAYEPAQRAKKLGIRMIITDHHEVDEELPEADAVINPHRKDSTYPYSDLCGAAVAFKVILALTEWKEAEGASVFSLSEFLFDELLLFAGFATIGDVVPLTGENRILAKEGLNCLHHCQNIGLNALVAQKDLDRTVLDAFHIGFLLGPCMNAAGRLKDASLALHLLESTDPRSAALLAQELSDLNEERKRLTEIYTARAVKSINEKIARDGKTDSVLGVLMPDAHESVAGIIAGRIKEFFYRPAFVVTVSDQEWKGSGRSIEKYNMIREISAFPQYFEKFGGHAKACGFTLKKGAFYDLMDDLNEHCMLQEKDLIDKTWIDMVLPLEMLSEELIEEIEMIKPFGQDNPKPLFAVQGLRLKRFQVLGENKRTLKMFVETENGLKMDAVMFGSAEQTEERACQLDEWMKEQGSGLRIACLYYPQINEFRGMRSIQLLVRDFDLSRG